MTWTLTGAINAPVTNAAVATVIGVAGASQTAVDARVNAGITALGLGTASTKASDTDGTLAANSDTRVPTQKAIKTYVDQIIAAQDAMVFKGAIDCSGNPNYPTADRGHTYRVSVAGKIGGASGTKVEVGDLAMCLTDGTAAGTQAAVGASWDISQTNIDGAVVGPASATDLDFAVYDGTSGKLIKDSGLALDTDGTLAANSDTKIPSQKAVKTYAQPKDADLTAIAALAPSDGQVMVWSTALGAWTLANPVGAGRIASNKNITGTPTTCTPMVETTITSTAISVGNSAGRPVVVKFGATFLQTALGRGSLYLVLEETTGTPADAMLFIAPLPNTLDGAEYILTLGYEVDIGVVTTTRTFEVRAFLYRASGSTATGNIINSTLNPSWCRAVAE